MSDEIQNGFRQAAAKYQGQPLETGWTDGAYLPQTREDIERGIMASLDRARRITPYVPPPIVTPDDEPQETVKVAPAVNLALQVSAVVFPTAGAIGFFQVLVSGALNTALGILIGCAGGAWLLSGIFSGVRIGGKTEYHRHEYNQYNQNNQNNG